MKHTRITITSDSKYLGRYCPVTKQQLNPGDRVVVCAQHDMAMAEIVFTEQQRCPFCTNAAAAPVVGASAGLYAPTGKPFPSPKAAPRPGYRSSLSRTAAAAFIAGAAALLLLLGAVTALLNPPSARNPADLPGPSVRVPDQVASSATEPSGQQAGQAATAAVEPSQIPAADPPPQQATVAMPPLVSRSIWGGRSPGSGLVVQRPLRIVLTHEEGAPCCDDEDDAVTRLRNNERVHREQRGWPDIAFHYIVSPGGNVYEGRPVEYRTDSSYAANNPDYPLDGTIVIGVLGNYNQQFPSAASIETITHLMAWLCQSYGIAPDDIYYLRDLAPVHVASGETSSPGTNMPEREQFRSAVSYLLVDR